MSAMFSDQSQCMREEFEQVISSRWLKTKEIYFMLQKPESLEKIGIKMSNIVIERPKSGTFILWDKRTGKNKYKKDSHDWITRKNNSNYVREDQENLKVNDCNLQTNQQQWIK